MLTVPGLCWLCRMPLALGHWGICSVCSRAARTDKTLFTRHTLTSSLRSLPAKTTALAKTGHGCRLCAAVKPANPPA
ncbi:Amidophosphoribosyltransferase family protein [Shigella dysenteriae WRSd3]|uniref:Amidophosphoribosyltransferase family protein n=1 Tax=Shigella dysenteriae WRSd3 TaxID=1401327 RepID=A0A090NY96_SHIDY|nr:Amidophosphoribosyltransferase family protein [Shigella dysenteriae WRSd3]